MVEKLIQGKIVYCEKCGFPLNPSNYSIEHLKKRLREPETPQAGKIIKRTTKRAYKKVRTKIQDLREKYKNH
ncbi:MAG: hypothetical protein EU535_07375 [Promethearchaeota archaeon]|nr:MAG: hypothetical protein EU535_07375 [Candidatus Lokiarchaeota archaeon]